MTADTPARGGTCTDSRTSCPCAVVRAYVQTVWTGRDVSRLADFVAVDCALKDAFGVPTVRGRRGVEDQVSAWHDAFASTSMSLTDVLCCDDAVSYRWLLRSRLAEGAPAHGSGDPVPGLPDYREIVLAGLSVARVRDGLIVDECTATDAQALTDQLRQARL